MRALPRFMLFFAAIFFSLAGVILAADGDASNARPAEEGIIGPWQAVSIDLVSEQGVRKDLSLSGNQALSVVISGTNMIMRVGDQKIAEMSYVLDSKQDHGAIDVKYQGQDMVGIWELKDNGLRISLNEAKKGRPKQFGAADNGMELVLNRYTGQPLFVMGADGSDPRHIPATGEYLSCSSPKWSRDGKIAYNACRKVFGENWNSSHIFVVNSDGSSPKDLGDGTIPSWSPDGKQIAYSRNSTGGVWIMDSDGSNKKLIEQRGWSVDWSPTNQDEVAYITSTGEPVVDITDATSGNIAVRNLKTNEVRTLLDKQYSDIHWYLTWSPDGRWICFLGGLPEGGTELAIVNAEGQSKGFKVLMPNEAFGHIKQFTHYFSWRPDGKRILNAMIMDGDDNRQLYLLDVEGKESPQKLAGQAPSRDNVLSCWSLDGKKIVFTSKPMQRPQSQ